MGARIGRTVGESRATVTRLTMPSDANFMGNVFGGTILSEVDRTAYLTACRHSGLNCVTASFDRVDFLEPVRLGQVVTFQSELTFVGRTSMEVWVQIHAQDLWGGPRKVVGDAMVTMVAVGQNGTPSEVPPLKLTTPEERRKFEEGRVRMEARKASRRPAGSPGGAGGP